MKILSNLKASALTGLKADNPNNPNSLTNKTGVLNTSKTKGSLANLKLKGFTLAEVLITLTIIGVVAALTIPSLLANVSDKTYDAKRKGLQTRLAQAISQMDSLNSYADKTDPEKNSSMNFVIEGLSKVYKITNVCEFDNFAACDFPDSYSRWWTSGRTYTKNYRKQSSISSIMTAENMGGLATDSVTFKTKNGESFLLWYNPRCVAEQDVDSENKKIWTKEVCASFLVDLDGAKKGPNIFGKDIIVGIVLYPDTPFLVTVVPNYLGIPASYPSYSTTGDDAEKFCNDSESFGAQKGGRTLTSREENYALEALEFSHAIAWTSNIDGSGPDDYGWMVERQYAKYMPRSTNSEYLSCVLKAL